MVGYKRPKCFWVDTKVFYEDTKNAFFFGIQKKFLTFSEVKRISFIVKLFLTFWKVKSGKGGVQKGDPEKAVAKAARSQQQQKQHSTSSSKLHKQQHKQKHQKQQQKQRTNRNTSRNTSSSRDTRVQKAGAPKVSLCSHWRILVECWWCFRGFFFETPVNFTTIGY